MMWHGGVTCSRCTEAEKVENDGDDLLPFKTNYVDHVSSGDSKQDWKAVLAYFEATILHIKRTLPHINEMCLKSDNAKCYKASELILLIVVAASYHDIKVMSFIHAGVQDVKSPLDGHFANAMRHVNRHFNEGHNVITPIALVVALRSNGGMPNSSAELVPINRFAIDYS